MMTPVLVELSTGPDPVVCFPPAGAGAGYFRFLARGMARAVVAVQYPGRESRHREPFTTRRPELVAEIAAGLAARPDLSGATFLGHSLGAALAFETAVARESAGPGPEMVVLSGRDATAPDTAPEAPDGELATDAQLRAWLLELGGTRPEVLDHPELAALVYRIARADLRLANQGGSAGTLRAPLRLLCGDRDPAATPAGMAGWAGRTTGGTVRHTLDGDHDALRRNIDRLRAILEERT